MEREIIRAEPFDTNFEKWGAPVSVSTLAGDMVFVSGLPPLRPGHRRVPAAREISAELSESALS